MSLTMGLETTASYGSYNSETTLITIPETNTTPAADVLLAGGITGLRVLRFVVPASWAGGDMDVDYVDRFGDARNVVVATSGASGSTVNCDFVCSAVTAITNTSAGVNAGRVMDVQMRSVICAPHAPVVAFVAVWSDSAGQLAIGLGTDYTNGFAVLTGPLADNYRMQYTVLVA